MKEIVDPTLTAFDLIEQLKSVPPHYPLFVRSVGGAIFAITGNREDGIDKRPAPSDPVPATLFISEKVNNE